MKQKATIWEEILKVTLDKELITKVFKELLKFNKEIKTFEKNVQIIWTEQRRYTDNK